MTVLCICAKSYTIRSSVLFMIFKSDKYYIIIIIFSSLTVEDEVRQISRLIACFIFRVDYGNDLEKYLNFYMEARGAFIRLDYVQSALVQVKFLTPLKTFIANNTFVTII